MKSLLFDDDEDVTERRGNRTTPTSTTTTTTFHHRATTSAPSSPNNNNNTITSSSSLFEEVASELSAALFPPSQPQSPPLLSSIQQQQQQQQRLRRQAAPPQPLSYPTLQSLMARAGITSLSELQQLSDDEFRELTRVHANYTPLQHAMAWHERQFMLASSLPSNGNQHLRLHQQRYGTQHINNTNNNTKNNNNTASQYNLTVMSQQTDLSLSELIQLSQEDFMFLSKQILHNDTLHHAKVYMEYTDAVQNAHNNNNNTNHNLLWFRNACSTNNRNNRNANPSTSTTATSMTNLPSCEELCCGMVGGVSTGSNTSIFRSQSPPTTTRKWSELGF